MGDTMKKQPPQEAKQHLIRLFFAHRKIDFPAILNGFERRGYDMDCFYWMYPEMNPSIEDLEKILAEEQFNLKSEEIRHYIKQYQQKETRY